MSSGPTARVARASEAALRAWLVEAVSAGRGAIVALAVGRSTLPLYGSLPADDPGLTAARILPVDELVPSPARPSERFEARLRAALPPGLAERVEPLPDDPDALEDLVVSAGLSAVVLGLGADGHIAFNQPGTPRDARSALIELLPDNLAALGDVAPATGALTMGVATILGAERIALVASGEGKRAAFERLLNGPAGDDMPVTRLREHPAFTIFADEALWT